MRTTELITGNYYHIFNRGVDKTDIFVDRLDFQRFYESMYLFSDLRYSNREGSFLRNAEELSGHEVWALDREPAIRLLSYNLLPNHFHMFLQQMREDGISNFLHKLQMSYSKYFNTRHHRTGSLFGGTYKAVPIVTEAHFRHIIRYIHLNALDSSFPEWRDGFLNQWQEAVISLDAHPWSSHHVYAKGVQELPLIDEAFVSASFSDQADYWEFLKGWAGRNAIPLILADT